MPISNREHVLTREHSCNMFCDPATDEHCQLVFLHIDQAATIPDLDKFFLEEYTFTAGTTITAWREAPESEPMGLRDTFGRWVVVRPSPLLNEIVEPVPDPGEYRGFVIMFTIEDD